MAMVRIRDNIQAFHYLLIYKQGIMCVCISLKEQHRKTNILISTELLLIGIYQNQN